MVNGVCATPTLKMDRMKTLKHQAYCKNCYFPTPDFKWFETTFRGIFDFCYRTLPWRYHLLHFYTVFYSFDIYSIDAFSNRGKKMEFATCPRGEVCALRGSHTEQSALTKWKCSQGISRDLNSSSAFFSMSYLAPNRIWLVQQWKPLQGPVYGMLSIWDPTISRVT